MSVQAVVASDMEVLGKRLRRSVPPEVHADLHSLDRDPVTLLDGQNQDRIQDLVPVRWGRMLQTPFAFYRGSAALMASDLSHCAATGLELVICGDAHLGNFGLYASPERRRVFDLNDFDEAGLGPWEWDLKRLATSDSHRVQPVALGAPPCTRPGSSSSRIREANQRPRP